MDPFNASGVDTEIILVTPKQAQFWLDNHNEGNRSISPTSVDFYARQMLEGKWDFTGDPIQFDVNGHMMNGQHRLMAVVKSGQPQRFLIVTGLAPKAIHSMDQGRKRTAADVVRMEGYSNPGTLAGITRVVANWERGGRTASIMGGGQNMLSGAEVVQYVQADPFLEVAAHQASTSAAKLLAPGRVYGSLWVLTHKVDFDQAESFFQGLLTGEGLAKGDPILALRKYWFNLNSKSRTIRHSTAFVYLQAGVRAWNGWAKGESMQLIVWKSDSIPELIIPKR